MLNIKITSKMILLIILIAVLCCMVILILSKNNTCIGYKQFEHLDTTYNSFKNLIGGKININEKIGSNKCIQIRVNLVKSLAEDSNKIPIIILTPINDNMSYTVNPTIYEVTATYFVVNINIIKLHASKEIVVNCNINWLGVISDNVILQTRPISKEYFTIKSNDFPNVLCDSGIYNANLINNRNGLNVQFTIPFNITYKSVPFVYLQINYNNDSSIYIANINFVTEKYFAVTLTNLNYNVTSIDKYVNNVQITWFALYTNESSFLYQLKKSNNTVQNIYDNTTAQKACSVYNGTLATKDQVISILDTIPVAGKPEPNLCSPGWMNNNNNPIVGYVMRDNYNKDCGSNCSKGFKVGTTQKCFNESKKPTSSKDNANVWCYGPSVDNNTSNSYILTTPNHIWNIGK